MNAVATFAVGTKVTVKTTPDDPIQVCLSPHVFIAAVVQLPEGPAYLVVHPGNARAIKFGPYTEDQLIEGWGS
jgi:hypothetical protein